MSNGWLVDEPLIDGCCRVRVLLVRHGESEWNVTGRIQGQAGSGLSPRGRTQADQAARYLQTICPDVSAIVSSDLERVVQTAEPFATATGRPIRTDSRLREIDNGEWTGRTTAEVAANYPDQIAAIRRGEDIPRGGGETFAQLRGRVDAALRDVARTAASSGAPTATVVVFSHGGPVRGAVAEALGLPPGGHRLLGPPFNCSVSTLDLLVDAEGTRRTVTVVGYNDVAYLGSTATGNIGDDDVAATRAPA